MPLGLSILTGHVSGHDAHLSPLDCPVCRSPAGFGRRGSQSGQADWALGAIGESHWVQDWQVLTRYQTCSSLILWVWGRARGCAICISSTFPGVANAAGPAITL